jgi:hypothetical protein
MFAADIVQHNMTYGDAGRMELLAMVESKMHEPK